MFLVFNFNAYASYENDWIMNVDSCGSRIRFMRYSYSAFKNLKSGDCFLMAQQSYIYISFTHTHIYILNILITCSLFRTQVGTFKNQKRYQDNDDDD